MLLMVLHCWVCLAVWLQQRSSEVIRDGKELRQQWPFPGSASSSKNLIDEDEDVRRHFRFPKGGILR